MAERSGLGASGIYRAPFLRALDRLGGWSHRLVRLGGMALMAAGVLGLVASTLFVTAVLRTSEGAFSYSFGGFYLAAALLQGLPRSALICVGLAGLCSLLAGAPKPVRRTALAGVALFSLNLVLPLALLPGQALGSQDAYGTISGPLFSRTYFFVLSVAPSVGIALCGVAAFWARGFGRWRFGMLAVGVLDSPLLYSLVFAIPSNRPWFRMPTLVGCKPRFRCWLSW